MTSIHVIVHWGVNLLFSRFVHIILVFTVIFDKILKLLNKTIECKTNKKYFIVIVITIYELYIS